MLLLLLLLLLLKNRLWLGCFNWSIRLYNLGWNRGLKDRRFKSYFGYFVRRFFKESLDFFSRQIELLLAFLIGGFGLRFVCCFFDSKTFWKELDVRFLREKLRRIPKELPRQAKLADPDDQINLLTPLLIEMIGSETFQFWSARSLYLLS